MNGLLLTHAYLSIARIIIIFSHHLSYHVHVMIPSTLAYGLCLDDTIIPWSHDMPTPSPLLATPLLQPCCTLQSMYVLQMCVRRSGGPSSNGFRPTTMGHPRTTGRSLVRRHDNHTQDPEECLRRNIRALLLMSGIGACFACLCGAILNAILL